MALGRLSRLQERLLELLAPVEPAWTLVGGAALAGFHTRHRATRDLDLFWTERPALGPIVEEVERTLRRADVDVASIQRSPGFVRFRVSDGNESVILDLVGEPLGRLVPVETVSIGEATISIRSAAEIFADKLCALMSRAEFRDLVDVRELLATGLSLEAGLDLAASKDGGFSAMTLAWVLRGLDLGAIADDTDAGDLAELTAFRDELITRLTDLAKPDG